MLSLYTSALKKASPVAKLWFFVFLAAALLYCDASFTRGFANLSFNIEDVIIFSINLSIRFNIGISEARLPNTDGIKRYISCKAYNIAKGSDLPELSVSDDFRANFDKCLKR